MWLEQVHQDDVGLLAGFERADLMLQAERARGIDGHHFQHLAVRQHARVAEVAAVVMHGLEHVAEHVVATVGCDAVRPQGHGHSGLQQLGHRAAPADRHDGAGVMHDACAGGRAGGNVFGSEVDGMRHKGRAAEQAQFVMRKFQGAGTVAVLREAQLVAPRHGHVFACLAAEDVGVLRLPGLVFGVVDGQRDADVHAAIGSAMLAADDLFTRLNHLLERDLAVGTLVAIPLCIDAWRWWAGWTHREEGARAGLGNSVAMACRVFRIVHTHDRVSAAEQAHTRGGTALEALQRREFGFGVPELLVGTHGIDALTGV